MAMSFTTRRRLLGAIAVVPALAAFTPAGSAVANAAATVTANPDRAAWDAAFGVMGKLVTEERSFGKIHDAAYDAYKAEAPTVPKWHGSAMSGMGGLDRQDVDGSLARVLADEGKTWSGDSFRKRFIDAADELRRFNAADQAADDRHNYTAIEARYDQIGDAAYDATWALFRLPAPDLAALAWKAEHLFGETARGNESSAPAWSCDVIETYMSDVRRLCVEA